MPISGPTDQALREFARTYRAELSRQPHRAMTAAAKAHDISRATANRWAELCRQREIACPSPARWRPIGLGWPDAVGKG